MRDHRGNDGPPADEKLVKIQHGEAQPDTPQLTDSKGTQRPFGQGGSDTEKHQMARAQEQSATLTDAQRREQLARGERVSPTSKPPQQTPPQQK